MVVIQTRSVRLMTSGCVLTVRHVSHVTGFVTEESIVLTPLIAMPTSAVNDSFFFLSLYVTYLQVQVYTSIY